MQYMDYDFMLKDIKQMNDEIIKKLKKEIKNLEINIQDLSNENEDIERKIKELNEN